jgi:membrane protein required for colicin V production
MLDLIIIILIFISAFFAFIRGFSLEILSLSGWIFSIGISYLYGGLASNQINKFLDNFLISTVISYVFSFILLLIIFSYLTKNVSSLIKNSFAGLLDRSLGFFYGLFRGYLLICFCYFCFDYFYSGSKPIFLESSKLIPIIKISNKEIFNIMQVDNEYSKKLRNEIEQKSNFLFKKSIDSKLKFKEKDLDNSYNEKNKKDLENIINNNLD